MLIHNSDGESTAIGPEATSPEKEEKDDLNNEKQKQIEPERKPSSKASDQQSKRSSSVKKEALTFSNSERLHLPAVRTQSVSSERTVSATPVKGLSNVRAGAMYSFILRALFECISRPLFHFVLVFPPSVTNTSNGINKKIILVTSYLILFDFVRTRKGKEKGTR